MADHPGGRMILIVIGAVYVVGLVFTLALCKAADRADRKLGYK